ncbi:hypothetical protein T310_8643, partial [Rasamsonia emersonii CBS 393.64]
RSGPTNRAAGPIAWLEVPSVCTSNLCLGILRKKQQYSTYRIVRIVYIILRSTCYPPYQRETCTEYNYSSRQLIDAYALLCRRQLLRASASSAEGNPSGRWRGPSANEAAR